MSQDKEPLYAALLHGDDQRDSALSELRVVLVRHLRKALSSYARADDPFLEDAVQDSLLRILERLDQFEGRSRFVTWATTIAIHVAMSELRRSRWRDVSLDQVVDETSPLSRFATDDSSGPGNQVERNTILEKMQEVIDTQLTEKQRTAILAEMNGMPQEEIARQLGSNRNAVYKLTHDARKKLKQGLEATGYGADDIRAAFAK
ncbi:RNA polymerase sigma factor [Lignipirellula cremea]|uniref:RNA polymerase sigma factor n=1 Tax=Lignipirellula cremea TaxID=2528010 RepID=A0A518DL95_9BACT|nr:sigma-70 family RNA polymerase sigma factor [Lignipirellula cremea]QDU92615.1 RNA polymerase sigma factor [Lignipirellula cremea]